MTDISAKIIIFRVAELNSDTSGVRSGGNKTHAPTGVRLVKGSYINTMFFY